MSTVCMFFDGQEAEEELPEQEPCYEPCPCGDEVLEIFLKHLMDRGDLGAMKPLLMMRRLSLLRYMCPIKQEKQLLRARTLIMGECSDEEMAAEAWTSTFSKKWFCGRPVKMRRQISILRRLVYCDICLQCGWPRLRRIFVQPRRRQMPSI